VGLGRLEGKDRPGSRSVELRAKSEEKMELRDAQQNESERAQELSEKSRPGAGPEEHDAQRRDDDRDEKQHPWRHQLVRLSAGKKADYGRNRRNDNEHRAHPPLLRMKL
jgi:hypothetical protein